jgi:hypothetical protein
MNIYSPTISGSLTISGSIITTGGGLPLTGSLISSGSFTSIGTTVVSGSLTVITGSSIEFQVLDTGVRIGNLATDNHTITGSLLVSGSITTVGNITAQTLVVQTITSSVSFITGSTKFGALSTNTHQFTGSVLVSGSIGIGCVPSQKLEVAGVIRGASLNFYDTTNPASTSPYLYSPNENDIGIGCNSATRMTISSSGNVGIGTTSPSVPLEVYLSGGGPTLRITNAGTGVGTGNGFHIGTDGSSPFDVAFVQNENASQVFYTNDGTSTAERLRIRSGGKVTIPSGAYGTSYYTMNYTSANAGSREWAIGSDTAGWGSFSIGQATTQGGSTFSDKIIISSAGNVGIGINSTSAKLYVLGSNEVFNVAGTSAVSAYTGYYYNTSTLAGYIGNGSSILSGAASSDFIFRSEGALVYAIGNSEKMRIDSGGNVYIGTTDPNATNFGMALLANGEIDISRSSGTNFVMNRSTTNGQIIDFRYNNTQVGSISTNSNSLPSDFNFKKDINDISIGLNLITKLRPVHYRHKMDEDYEALSNGIIAQELEQSLLECGIEKNSLLMLQHKPNEKQNESQYWVDYTKMIPILIKGIQELSAKVTLLENK